FHETDDRVASAYDEFIVQRGRHPGDTDARHELLIVRVVQRAAIAVFAGEELFAGGEVEIRLAVGDFVEGLRGLPAGTEGQCEIAAEVPIVLEEKGGGRMAMSPLAGYTAAAFFAELVQQEVGEAVAGIFRGAVVEEAQSAVVAGVIAILLEANHLEAGLQDVNAAHDGEIVSDLIFVL